MSTDIELSTTNWPQHRGNGNFVWVRSFTGTTRTTADGHFKVTILENHGINGGIERRLMFETEEDYSPGKVDEWVLEVVTVETARERLNLITEACNEIEQRAAQEKRYTAADFPSSGGSQWGDAHLALRSEQGWIA